jgi:hypothetical protein
VLDPLEKLPVEVPKSYDQGWADAVPGARVRLMPRRAKR